MLTVPLWESQKTPLCRLSAEPHGADPRGSAVCCPPLRRPTHRHTDTDTDTQTQTQTQTHTHEDTQTQ